MIDVTYILSVNYSGSHMLAELLGAHSRCASIGELRNYRKFLTSPEARTTVSDFGGNPLFAGLAAVPERNWYPLIHERVCATHPGVSMLIDNSKKIEWAEGFARDAGIRAHYVHLIRDPRALLRRWSINYDALGKRLRQRRKLALRAPDKILVALAGSDYEVLLYKWLLANRRISDFMRIRGSTGLVLTYRDLATCTEDTLRKLMPRLGLDFEVAQLHFADGKHYGTRKAEYLEMSARSEIRFDCRWREDLPTPVQQSVTRNRNVLAYLDTLGLRFCDAGLTAADGGV